VSLLLDSHALLWFLRGDADRFPSTLRDLIEDPGSRVVVSVASQWELMLKVLAGRLRLPDAPDRFLLELPEESGFRVLQVQPRHVGALVDLPQLHGDPFDRILVAQALVEDFDLVTSDPVVRSYPVRTIWG
jgi:PIN domain nuclease of toxin-antitoxin system